MLIVPGQPARTSATAASASPGATCSGWAARACWDCRLGSMLQLQAASAARPRPAARPAAGRAGARPRASSWSTSRAGPATSTSGTPRTTSPTTSGASSSRSPPRCPGIQFTEILPKLAQINDKFTFIRSMSYTPNGLFNHTAAIYQMMTGYTTDKVSPSGQLEPPSPKDFPNFGSQHHPAQAADRADAAVRHAAAAAAGIERRRQGRHGRLPRQGVRPVHALPRRRRHGHGQDGPDQGRRPPAPARGLRHAARAAGQAPRGDRRGHARDREGRRRLQPQRVLRPGARAWSSRAGPARRSTSAASRPRSATLYGRNTFGQSCLLARRLVEAGTRVVEVIWPKVANSDNHSWDHHVGLTNRMKNRSGPMLDAGPVRPASPTSTSAGCSTRRPGRRRRRVRPQPAEGREHLGQRQQRRRPRPLAVLLHRRHRRRRDQARLRSRQVRQDRLRAPSKTRSTPASCWRRSTTPSASTRPRSSTTT